MLRITDKLTLLAWYKDPSLMFKEVFNIEPYTYQREILRDFPKLKRIMLMGPGDSGKTVMIAGMALWASGIQPVFINRPYNTVILSGSKEQASRAYKYIKDAITNNKVLSEIVDGEPLATRTLFKHGSIIQICAKSLTSIQGAHSDMVIIDEAATKELDFFIQDSLRIIPKEGRIVLSSTPHEADCEFVRRWMNKDRYPDYSKERPYGWKRYHWTALDCPRVREKLEEAMKLPRDVFERYYMAVPYSTEDTVVPLEHIRAQSEGIKPFNIDPDNREGMILFGIDVGFKAGTILVVTQKINDEYRVIDVLEWKLEKYEDVQEWIKAYALQYKPDYIYVDMLPKEESQRIEDRLGMLGFRVIPVSFSTEKPRYQARMRALFQNRKVWIPEKFYELLEELRRYKWDTKVGDDRVVALMLALSDPEPKSYTGVYVKVAKPIRRMIRL